jgi:hypothetical protein
VQGLGSELGTLRGLLHEAVTAAEDASDRVDAIASRAAPMDARVTEPPDVRRTVRGTLQAARSRGRPPESPESGAEGRATRPATPALAAQRPEPASEAPARERTSFGSDLRARLRQDWELMKEDARRTGREAREAWRRVREWLTVD